MDCHHVGVPEQHDIVHACVMKINGVAMQCIKQSILAIEPMLSGLYIIDFIFLYYKKYKYILIATMLQLQV